MTTTTDVLKNFQQNSLLAGSNAVFVEDLYEQYLANPAQVSPDWQAYFAQLPRTDRAETAHSPIVAKFEQLAKQPRVLPSAQPSAAAASANGAKQAGVLRLINYHRSRGHQVAKLDPLGLIQRAELQDLNLEFQDLEKSDLDKVFNVGSLATPTGEKELKLSAILDIVQRAYLQSVGAEYMYITDTKEKRWIQARLEKTVYQKPFTTEEQKRILTNLTAAEGLEKFLHTKYVGQKRFSLEGSDSMIPAIDEIIRGAARHKAEEVVIGMAHRGRLNVLINIMGKSPKDLFNEFEGNYAEDKLSSSGDVKYHMGFSTDVNLDGQGVHLVLAFNPSHLEIVNPVVEGSVRARQEARKDTTGDKVLAILIHGDAAFAGQGVNLETLQLSQAKNFATGGTVHIVVNNQVGFTTTNAIEVDASLRDAPRTSRYCTDLAKMLDAPVFHVNGDDAEAVAFVSRLAMDFRAEFHKDVIIDLVSYRRWGHNEADEPNFTQPQMYEIIRKHPTPRAHYAARLVKDNVISAEFAEQLVKDYKTGLEQGKNIARSTLGLSGNQRNHRWDEYLNGKWHQAIDTAVPAEILQQLTQNLLNIPESVKVHPKIQKVLDDRAKMVAGELNFDWGGAETLAYASLMKEGYPIRLSGQDSGRGTFSHRHAVIHDQQTLAEYTPLEVFGQQLGTQFVVSDTLLSEAGVLGFEYGYSTAEPNTLTIWEAQFGDFANGAQVVIDQFIASGQTKWGRFCGLTLFLPHGYEGQGPEHSSARLERYLQLCADDNIQVCVPSTPAQFFHMLRRQMVRDVRLPLIVMTPKSLLRLPASSSPLSDLTDSKFYNVIPDPNVHADNIQNITRLILCSGKVYFDVVAGLEKLGANHIAVSRLEQLYPFPHGELQAEFARYPNLKEMVWCQEEPRNQGAWHQIKHRLMIALKNSGKPEVSFLCASRKSSASTAVGYHKVHVKEQAELVQEALAGGQASASA